MRLTRGIPAIPDSVFAAFDRRLDPASATPVVVAYSGGGDSLLLLLAAKAWADRWGRQLLALHVDHRLQPDSSAWAERARAVAGEVSGQFRLLTWDGEKPSIGLPAAARAARLILLAEATRDAGARAILLGHTDDDLREADLMQAEGASLGRMGEWSPSPIWPEGRGLFHFRPLLSLGRADIRSRLSDAGWDWIDDPANDDPTYARSRARAALDSPASPFSRFPGECRGPDDVHWGQGLVHLDPGIRREARIVCKRGAGRLGSVETDRASAADADPSALKVALVCASGGSRLPRTERLDRLRDRIIKGADFTATLAGARIAAKGDQVLICRDAGEYARAGSPRVALEPSFPATWDGRFEVTANEAGWTVLPLKGLAARLPKVQREALKAIPASVRPSLPVMVNAAETVTCPLLAEVPGVRVRPLIAGRMAAALGLVRTEAEAAAAANGALNDHALSWVMSSEKADTA